MQPAIGDCIEIAADNCPKPCMSEMSCRQTTQELRQGDASEWVGVRPKHARDFPGAAGERASLTETGRARRGYSRLSSIAPRREEELDIVP